MKKEKTDLEIVSNALSELSKVKGTYNNLDGVLDGLRNLLFEVEYPNPEEVFSEDVVKIEGN